MFISELFTVVRTWKQMKSPSTNKWVKKTWDTHRHKNTVQPSKEKTSPSAAWLDLEVLRK